MNRKDLDSIYPNPVDSRSKKASEPRRRTTLKLVLRILIDGVILALIIFLAINWRSFRPYYDYLKGQAQHVILDFKNTQTPTPSPVSTAGWQSLKNQKYCYEVSYPANWIYYPWESPITKAWSDTYQETLAFDSGTNKNNSGGDIRILTFKEVLEQTIADIQNATEISNTGPNKFVANETVVLGGTNFKKLTFSRFSTLPPNFDGRDLQTYYITSGSKYSYVFSLPPYPNFLNVDQKIIESFKLISC